MKNAKFYSFCQQAGVFHDTVLTHPSKSGEVGSNGGPCPWDTGIVLASAIFGATWPESVVVAGRAGTGFVASYCVGYVPERGRWEWWERITL